MSDMTEDSDVQKMRKPNDKSYIEYLIKVLH